ncbi:MAG TPA: pitrilysin family protein [Gemmatimonadaceae bacterium]|nr:pitrilysin family protein [Gemmatimonadaceae bacterium]
MSRGHFIMVAASVAIGSPLFAQTTAPAEPPMGTLKPFTMPAIERIKLSNGMTLALVPFGSVPQTTLFLNTFAGDIDAGDRPWLAALTADVMKQGAGGKDAKQLAEALSEMGGSLSVFADANNTQVSTTVLSERAGDAMALLADVVRRPNMTQADFDRIKSDRRRQLAQAFASPQRMADVLLAKAIYGDHPYGVNLPTAAQLDAISLADVKAFHTGQYGAARSTLYVIGQFDKAAVRTAAERALGSWAAGPPRKMLPATFIGGPRLILADRPGSEQTTVRLAYAAPAAGTADDIPFRVADALLGGSFGSRITSNIRENKGYTYSPFSNTGARPGGATWIWNGDITPSVTGAAMTEVFNEIRRLQTDPPTSAEAQGMKTYAGTYVLMRMTGAELIARQLVRADLLGLPDDYFPNYVPRAMAVTPEQMRAMAQRMLPLDKLVLVVVGDMKTVEPQLMAVPELKAAKIERVTLPKL